MSAPNLGDSAWQRFLQAKGIDLAKDPLPIRCSMKDLKRLAEREPRLLLSMDTRDRCPQPLRQHGVFPLSVNNTEFLLVKGDGWFDFPSSLPALKHYEARLSLDLAASTVSRGENAHIMRLETAGVLREFVGATTLQPSFSGKRATPRFSFRIRGTEVTVDHAQYEVDAGYTTVDDVIVVEAKKAHYRSCAIRQVYYPYRAIGEDEKWSKAVRSLFITFDPSAEDYIVRELFFQDRYVWESMKQEKVEHLKVRLVEPPRNVLDLSSSAIDNPRIPQADSVARIQEMPLLVSRAMRNASTIAQYYEFDKRQSSYYRDAVESLGLLKLDEENNEYDVTPDGRRYLEMSPQARADYLARRMSRLPVMRAVLSALETAGPKGLGRDAIATVLLDYAKGASQRLNPTTARRRASTIRAYLDFIGSRTGALARVGDRYYLRKDIPNLERFDAAKAA